ncbi:choline dehydrogenase-like flavoprotein [Sinobacterium caligoides]|uniref:Choline dehydrogenase-like flavoprotein n=1 Tax=Sinobacterium caligoides TaxID=933926 RepID=A0A3N2E0J1_9GAMM|nr:GMC family oxidoreductase [Sinobacterium caligoides]ROS05631.1 choline dehydrogenase-like flavoprotein [Sinobacterium caligoides]
MATSQEYDAVIIGSGAGAGPVALTLSEQGYKVLVLEKGPWYREQDYYKDELAAGRRNVYTPQLKDEFHVLEEEYQDGSWRSESTADSGWSFWNGNVVGGSSNFMSGFFYRLKPSDLKLKSTYGNIDGANVADWPIDYAELEPYYSLAEHRVGISGKVVKHAFLEPRSEANFPLPPTAEHAISGWFDSSSRALGFTPLPTARAVLSVPQAGRHSCEYAGYCGSYGCATGAKGSARAALLDPAVATGNCEIRPHSKVFKIESNARGEASAIHYYDRHGARQSVRAKVYVVACQAIESARLLLASTGPKHPDGLGNRYQQVGKNLLFSAGGVGHGDFYYDQLTEARAEQLKVVGPFVNRGLQDWYQINDKQFTGQRAANGTAKGGTIDFLLAHPNAISRANRMKWDADDRLLWGGALKTQLHQGFTGSRTFDFEVFNDWLPTDNCFVSLDPEQRDRWGDPVAKIRIGFHDHDLQVGEYMAKKGEQVLQHMGAKNIRSNISGYPAQNLQAGGCRFGDDPRHSVLDRDCRIHDCANVFVSDGSFMPTGGSVPYTWTIYANAFRVADKIVKQLG